MILPDTQEIRVAVGLERSSVAALETLLAEIAFHATGLREALVKYRHAADPPREPWDVLP